ncbi:GNAT family N-acetyltransferase [Massilia sp. CF038]|uniref:GNAT family N-acetyltransferase n=1 Tax=Massilia sp. CF038 TaxID=1881045 RepID=UPI00091DD89D|nr:GNAT family N-acetyltransferase [Massilia sp. CF038]SHH20824.1 N-acetylglutamate synthase, GNAT family [Massilia sp. CF038]
MHVGPTTPITLRPAQASDAAGIADLFIQLGYDTPLSHLQQQLSCAGAEVTVAMDHGALVGVLVMHLFAPLHVARPWAVISALVVDATWRSQGAGAALVAHAQQWAQARNCAHLELACSEKRTEAHRFYLTQGFQEVRKRFVKRF